MRKAFAVTLVGEGQPQEMEEEVVDDETLWEDVDEIEDEVNSLTERTTRLLCLAHSLQLAIGDGLKVIDINSLETQ